MKYIIVLFFNLQEMNIKHEIIEKVEQILDDYDYQLYMMKEMGHMLPPLDYWNQKEKKFDEWQYNIIQSVHRNESIILKAPTSSGKTFIAMSAGIFHKKVLYVCPAKPVAYQVGELHSPKRDGETRLIRKEGQNLEGIKRDKYQRA